MTATSVNGLRNTTAGTDHASAHRDEKMDQVRELLIGDYTRRYEARLEHLEHRQAAFEREIGQRVDALGVRIDAMAGELTGERRAAFEELSRSVGALSDRIRNISKT